MLHIGKRKTGSLLFLVSLCPLFYLFGIVGGTVFVRSIAGPVKKVMGVMQRVAKGDLTEKLTGVKVRDEIGEMASYTNTMIDGLGEIINQIRANASQVASASTQIVASSEQTSKNSEASAATVEEITLTMYEMSANIQNVARNIQGQAASVTETSSSVEQMIASIQRITDHVNRIVDITQKTLEAVMVGRSAVGKASSGMEYSLMKAKRTFSAQG